MTARNATFFQDKDDSGASQLSLFEGDLVNRAFARIGIGSRKPLDLLLRMLVIIGITWVPMAGIAAMQSLPAKPTTGQIFFYDFAAYAQFFIGIPLFILAERIISENILSAARDFEDSGVIAGENLEELHGIEREIGRLRRQMTPELICVIIAYILSFWALVPELFWHSSGMKTWHVDIALDGTRRLTPTAIYAILVALPIQTYWWLRWVWKIGLWYWYLSRIAKFRLVLVASHPDHTGGIGFLSEVQAKFAIVILAFGISNVVAVVGYKIAVEHAPVDLPPVWGLVVGFTLCAPALFLAPLLLFTKQLGRTKKRALAQFREKAMKSALRVEQQWLHSDPEHESAARTELAQLQLLSGFYDRIHQMRVVPFDLRSAGQLIGSAVGPMIPLLPYFIKIPEPWQHILEALTKWLPHGG